MLIPQHRSIEFIVLVLAFFVILWFERRNRPFSLTDTSLYYRVNDFLLRTAYRPVRAYGYLAGYTLSVLLLLSVVAWPHPIASAEFSHQLAADTFAHGRLTNPSHPLWTFFETHQIISQPFYASSLPPAQGMIMAFGQVVFGSSVVGVWLTYVLAVLAVYWLLTLCLPPVQALLGGWLVASHSTFVLSWGLAFWDGGVPMLGGALLLGGAIALQQQSRGRYVLLMAVGVLALWTSQPYEGVVFSVIPLVMLLYVAQQTLYWQGFRPMLRWMLGLLGLFLAIAALPAYDYQTTGNPTKMPYAYYNARYEQARPTLLQKPRREPVYNRPEMKKVHKRESAQFFYRHSIEGFFIGAVLKINLFETFYLGVLFLLPFLLFLTGSRSLSDRLCYWSILLLFGANLLRSSEQPQHLAAATGPLAVAVGQGLLILWQTYGHPLWDYPFWQRPAFHGWQLWSRRLVLAILLASVPVLLIETGRQAFSQPRQAIRQRLAHETQLADAGGRHIVLVKYGPNHPVASEWVFNQALIDSQPVIWAVDKGAIQNQALLRYYPDRTVWQLRPEDDPSRLFKLSASANQAARR
ncbi:hypothetical protein BN8_02581 [Fibrisoma limi BUZ 3]|uniref:Glycosyltransferase RgtA/B/C/D-like domain-containing protein n=1 Tax=Fibrisoma limi BUZ 3 TaxID=1185876 RepID=I2GHV8_9BACT|nr:hypothetical protein [Fibrisoma limi]CCH53483.1 hypothetical protein BN8_02581 [Fibrisoma limi BUZ 3]